MASRGAVVALAAILLAGSGVAYGQLPCVTPYQSAAKNADLTHVAKAMEITGMSSTFNSTSLKATIFLPKDEAFTALLSTLGMTLDQALNASSPFTPFLGQILEYHVVPNQVIQAAEFTQGEVLPTVINETLTVGLNPLTITPTGGKAATVTFTDFIACESVEHVLDTVLLPQSVVQAYTAMMAKPAVVSTTPVLPAIALPPLAVTTVTPTVITTPVAPAPAPIVNAAEGPAVIPNAINVTFAQAPAPMVVTKPAVAVTASPVLPAVALPPVAVTTVTPAVVTAPQAVLPVTTTPVQAAAAQVTAAATPMVSQITSEVDALKQKLKPTPVVVTPIQTPPAPVQPISGVAVTVAPPPPAVVILPKKEDLLAILKDKLLPAAAAVPPPPAPIAISGAPLSVTTTPVVPTVPVVEKPKNLTALQLPQLDLPMPQKPQIDLPTVPAVPVYQFQLPDIKAEIQNLGQSAVDKIKSLTPQVTVATMAPPPPVMISGTAISGAPITVPPPPPTVIDIPVLPPKKPLLFPFKKKGPFSLIDKLKEKLLAPVIPVVLPVAAGPVSSTPVSGMPVSGADQQTAGLLILSTPATANAAAPVAFELPSLPAVQLPNSKFINKPLHHYSRKKDGPLVIHVPILDGASNSINDTLNNVVTPNSYTITEGSGLGYTSGSASAGATSSTLVTAAAGPAVDPTAMPDTNATVYSSATCSTVPKTAQMVPDMTDFLAGLQATGLDKKLDNATAMATVFVPINAAFDALAQQLNASLPALLAQTDMLTQILEYHVVPGMTLASANLTDGLMLQTTLPGQSIKVQKSNNTTRLLSSDGTTSANVIYADVRACNAIIQVIDAVLSPQAVANVMAPAPMMPAQAQPMVAAGGR